MSARDARFDGQFITGVHSTGIYCRPSCPAVTPKAGNVTFYLTAAAAHEAGLRACKRCLPDAVPGSPEWNVRDDLAARAMRLIADGAVEREGVPGLAHRLSYTPRHLGRVLTAELGAGPSPSPGRTAPRPRGCCSPARTCRSPRWRSPPDSPACGSSTRRWPRSTDVTPGAIRASARRRPGIVHARRPGGRDGRHVADPAAARQGPVRRRAAARLPRRTGDLGNGGRRDGSRRDGGRRDGGRRRRRHARLQPCPPSPARPGDHPPHARRRPRRPAVECEATLADLADLAPLVARVRRLLDLDADAEAIDAALAADPVLAPAIAAAPGLRVPGAVDPEEILFRALIGQQVSVPAARTALARLTDALGEPVAIGGFTRLFPTAQAIAERGREVLRGPGKRIDAIVVAAAALADGSDRHRRRRVPRRAGGPADRPAGDRRLDGRVRRPARAGQPGRAADRRPGAAAGGRPARPPRRAACSSPRAGRSGRRGAATRGCTCGRARTRRSARHGRSARRSRSARHRRSRDRPGAAQPPPPERRISHDRHHGYRYFGRGGSVSCPRSPS